MSKKLLAPSTRLFPLPAALVSCVGSDGVPNIITIAWTGVVCSEPPMISISIRPKARHSYPIVKPSNEFVLNIPSASQARTVDWCGMVSGSRVRKFDESGLTPATASAVKAPLIAECPVNVECVVQHRLSLGTHDCFIGEVVAVHADEGILDGDGRISVEAVQPLAFCDGDYWTVGSRVGAYGFSRGRLAD